MLRAAALVMSLLGVSNFGPAETPKTVQAGSIVNSWIQGGLRVTDQLFDFAIQGHGFFALKMANGDFIFTRHGAFFLDQDGYLAHKTLGGRLLIVDPARPTDQEPLRLSEALTKPQATVKSIRVNLDGMIEGVYADGYVHQLARVKLATFQNARRLQRPAGEHTLYPTAASGQAYFGMPQTESYGSVYSSTLEETDSIYDSSLD